jgi:hypothetical protein
VPYFKQAWKLFMNDNIKGGEGEEVVIPMVHFAAQSFVE